MLATTTKPARISPSERTRRSAVRCSRSAGSSPNPWSPVSITATLESSFHYGQLAAVVQKAHVRGYQRDQSTSWSRAGGMTGIDALAAYQPVRTSGLPSAKLPCSWVGISQRRASAVVSCRQPAEWHPLQRHLQADAFMHQDVADLWKGTLRFRRHIHPVAALRLEIVEGQ